MSKSPSSMSGTHTAPAISGLRDVAVMIACGFFLQQADDAKHPDCKGEALRHQLSRQLSTHQQMRSSASTDPVPPAMRQ
jgi:hypothetical protein